ncbi:MAG: spore coat protein [Bacilli bacterium]|nr:spore coat protein [Bacilli bacterium]
MNDQLLMENYLLLLKSDTEVYVHGTLESSNEDVRKVLKNGLDETMKSQSDTYNLMSEYGWYNIKNISSKEICKTLEKVENK